MVLLSFPVWSCSVRACPSLGLQFASLVDSTLCMLCASWISSHLGLLVSGCRPVGCVACPRFPSFWHLQCSWSRPVSCVARLWSPFIRLHSTMDSVLYSSSFIAETADYGVPLSSRVVVFGQGMLLAWFALCFTSGLYALHVVCILDIMSSLDFLF